MLDDRITNARRVLKVRLSPQSETTIRPSVLVLTPSTTYDWIALPGRAASATADLVRQLVDLHPTIAIERVYSRWNGGEMRPWPEALWKELASALRERYLLASPVEVVPDEQ
jgi:hypothetical protein